MRKALSIFIAVCLVLSLFTGAITPTPSARADTEGVWIYAVAGGKATITGYAGPGGVVVIPSTIGTGPYPVTSIGNSVFMNCTGLTSVTIPNSVTSLGTHAFFGCTGLTGVTIGSGLTSIGDGTFYNCTGLTTVTIPNSVTSIDYEAFYGCAGLTTVTIPNSVTSIGYGTFQNCTGLTSVTIPDSVTTIDSLAFMLCSRLTAAHFLGNAPTIGTNVFASCATGFKVWYICGKTGWTNPWHGYPTANNCGTPGTSLVLSTSWNLISVPINLPVASITGLQSVYGYHDGWSVPTTLVRGEGYWVQVQNAVTIPVPGTPSTAPVPLTYQAGWQLLGNPFDVPLPISSITNHAYITTCYSYGPAWGVLNPATDSLQPGKGYWIQLSVGTTLTLTHP